MPFELAESGVGRNRRDDMLSGVAATDPKDELRYYLHTARDALLWKLDGLTEYDIRRPLTPTGTNLLGLIKHVATVEVGYFGDTFGRPFGESLPWIADDAEPNADMWATADESREQIVGLYHRVVGARRRHDRRAGAGRDRRRAVVAGGSPRGDAAHASWCT